VNIELAHKLNFFESLHKLNLEEGHDIDEGHNFVFIIILISSGNIHEVHGNEICDRGSSILLTTTIVSSHEQTQTHHKNEL